MSDDDSSDLSSAPSDDELERQLNEKGGILKFLTAKPPAREASPPRPPREPSPPHEYVLADNPDIAVCACIYSRVPHSFTRAKRVLSTCAVADAISLTVHRYVSITLYGGISQVPSQLWPPRTRTRCGGYCAWRACRALSLRVAWTATQQKAGYQVRSGKALFLLPFSSMRAY
jgi:hypothetical protein